MAQRHEVEAWVNPSAWDDEAEARRVVEAILESGSDDEAEWVRIAGGDAQDVEAAEGRDFDRTDAAGMWLREDVAAHLGVRADTVSGYVSRGQMPAPDGYVGRTPWWRPESIRDWVRPGRGARTDLS